MLEILHFRKLKEEFGVAEEPLKERVEHLVGEPEVREFTVREVEGGVIFPLCLMTE